MLSQKPKIPNSQSSKDNLKGRISNVFLTILSRTEIRTGIVYRLKSVYGSKDRLDHLARREDVHFIERSMSPYVEPTIRVSMKIKREYDRKKIDSEVSND